MHGSMNVKIMSQLLLCGRNLLYLSSEGSDNKFLLKLPGYTVSQP